MRIELSQVVILLAILAFALYAFSARTVLRDRIIYLALTCTGVTLALYPELSTRVANLIGIGRGADLLLYVFVLFSLFHYASLASQLKRMEQQITMLARVLAIGSPLAGVDSGSRAQRPAGVESGSRAQRLAGFGVSPRPSLSHPTSPGDLSDAPPSE